MRYLWLNDDLCEADKAAIGANDLGILRGYAVFDFLRVEAGVPVFLGDHLDRFSRSAKRLGISLPLERAALTERIFELIKANGTRDALVRMVLTGGYSEDGFTPSEPNLLIMQHDPPADRAQDSVQGAHLMGHPYVRDIPDVKTTNYAMVLALLPKLRQLGAEDVLWHDQGLITESSRSNVFLLDQEGRLRTPEDKVLHGITRKHVIELAEGLVEVVLGAVPIEELDTAAEMFMTSTTKGVMPITEVDGRAIGAGTPGRVTAELARLLRARKQAYVAEHRGAVAT